MDLERFDAGLEIGSRVSFLTRIGPVSKRWIGEHIDFQPGKLFRDVQIEGPFAHWDHTHTFTPGPNGQGCVLEDRVEYRLPLGPLGALFGGPFVRSKLERMFRFRHQRLAADLSLHAHTRIGKEDVMKVAVTGASGLVGGALVPLLTTGGHSAVRLVRRNPRADGEARWDPATGAAPGALEGVDAIVHLAGENIAGKRWSAKQKQEIRDSRVLATRALCESLTKLSVKPKTLICASAIGYYGDRGDEQLDESSAKGTGFLAEVCDEWEAATQPAKDAGIRVVHMRFGIILSPKGGALAKMLLPFKLGGGGILGSGNQYMSWISLDDVCGAILHALTNDSLSGPVNTVAPAPVTNREYTKTLGSVLKRPTIFPMPAFAARAAFGEMADHLLLGSQRVQPKVLLDSGYRFQHTQLEDALRHLLGKSPSSKSVASVGAGA